MSSTQSNEYALRRGALSAARLDLQHHGWVATYGYHLHPALPPPSEGLRILDVGTGTGIWACEVAVQRPNSTVYGTDIDLMQCPATDWLPPNVVMQKLDILGSTIPDDLLGTFDIVHLRHFQIVTANPTVPLQNMMKLLKPGGWLQWGEFDLATREVCKTKADVPGEKQEQMMRFIEDLKPPQVRDDSIWVSRLRAVLEKEGLEIMAHDVRRPAPWARGQSWNVALMSYQEMSWRLPQEKGDKLRGILAEAEDEWLTSGKALAPVADYTTIVARKPGRSPRL